MPILSEEKKKRQYLLLILVILFFGGTGVILWQGILKSRTPDIFVPGRFIEGIPEKLFGEEASPSTTVLERLTAIKLDDRIFDDPRFVSLVSNAVLPIAVKKEDVGRENPFIPFVF